MKDGSDSAKTQQTAFEKSADALGFNLKHTSFEVGEHTDIGLLLGPLAGNVIEFEVPDSSVAFDKFDATQSLGDLINAWERCSPDDLVSNIADYATDPFLLVGSDGIGQIDHSDVVSNADKMKEYPLHSPRKVTIDRINVINMGGGRAAATYVFSEEFTDGTSIHSNAVAIAVKLKEGWRLILATDHLAS